MIERTKSQKSPLRLKGRFGLRGKKRDPQEHLGRYITHMLHVAYLPTFGPFLGQM